MNIPTQDRQAFPLRGTVRGSTASVAFAGKPPHRKRGIDAVYTTRFYRRIVIYHRFEKKTQPSAVGHQHRRAP